MFVFFGFFWLVLGGEEEGAGTEMSLQISGVTEIGAWTFCVEALDEEVLVLLHIRAGALDCWAFGFLLLYS